MHFNIHFFNQYFININFFFSNRNFIPLNLNSLSYNIYIRYSFNSVHTQRFHKCDANDYTVFERRLCSSSRFVYTLVQRTLFYGLLMILLVEFYDVAIAIWRLTPRIFSISRFSLRGRCFRVAFSALCWPDSWGQRDQPMTWNSNSIISC